MPITSTSGAWNVKVFDAEGIASLDGLDLSAQPLSSASVTGQIDQALATFDAPSNGEPYAATLTAEITLDQAEDISFYLFAAGHARLYVDGELAGEVTVADLPGAGEGPCPANGGAVCLCQADNTYAQEKIAALVSEGTHEIKIEFLNLDPSGAMDAQWAVGDIGRRALDLTIPEATVDQDLEGNGEWGDLKDWPVIAVHSAVLDDGRVLTFGGDETGFANGKLYYDVWDPVTDTHIRYDNYTDTDTFCAAMIAIPGTSKVIIVGGDALPSPQTPLYRGDATVTTLQGVQDINIFDADTGTLTPAPDGDMLFARWYPTVVTLPTGQVLVLGGAGSGAVAPGFVGISIPEIYTYGEGWKPLYGAEDLGMSDGGANYPRSFVRDDGKIVYFHQVDTGDNNGLRDGGSVVDFNDWRSDGDVAGRWNPRESDFANEAPAGSVVGYINDGSIIADTGALYNSDQPYSLTMSVGARNVMTDIGYSVALYAGDVLLGRQEGVTAGGGTWESVAITVDPAVTGAVTGAEIRIEITKTTSGAQLNVDGVRLVQSSSEIFASSFEQPDEVPTRKVLLLDPTGDGSLEQIAELPFAFNNRMPSIQYADEKVLAMSTDGSIWSMDYSSDTPTFDKVGELPTALSWSNMTVLADGTIMINGGSSQINREAGANYSAIIVDPYAGTVTDTGEEEFNPRLYHSTAVLLRDGTVLTSGGGAAPPYGENSYLDGQVYRPAYLYDENGDPAERPVIYDVPFNIMPGQTVVLGIENAPDLARLTMVKTNAVTHSVQMDAGFLELEYTMVSPGQVEVTIPDISDGMRPGNWMLFAWNDAGTPSMAPIIRVNPVLDPGNADPDELLLNGDLEIGYDGADGLGWAFEGDGGFLNDAARATSGESLYSIASDAAFSQTVATQSGQIYTLAFDAAAFGAQATLTVEVLNGTTPDLVKAIPVGDGQTYTLTFMASGSNTTVRFANDGNVGTSIDVDSLSLKATAENLLWNGSFEAGRTDGPDSAFGWDVSDDVAATGEAEHGKRALELGAGDSVSQTVATSTGQSYQVGFDADLDEGDALNVSFGATHSIAFTKAADMRSPALEGQGPEIGGPALEDGAWAEGLIGFDIVGSAGTWNPPETAFPDGEIPDGGAVGWINEGSVSTVLDAGYSGGTASVSLLLGARIGLGDGAYDLKVFAGDRLVSQQSGTVAGDGTLQRVELDVPAQTSPSGPLRLEIVKTGGSQINFDNLSLASASPFQDFEGTELADRAWTYGAASFIETDTAGIWNPGENEFASGEIPSGAHIGWINSGAVSIDLPGTYQPDQNFVVSVEMGARIGSGDADYTLGVYAGDTLVTTASGTAVGNGTFETVAMALPSTDAADLAGLPLRLEIEKTSGVQVNFDDVSLENSADMLIRDMDTPYKDVPYWNTTLDGWDIEGFAGTWNPKDDEFDTTTLPDAGLVGWINSGKVSKTIVDVYDASVTSLVSVMVGARTDSPDTSYVLRLFAGDVELANQAGVLTGNGEMTSATLLLEPGTALNGMPLRLEIEKTGSAQVNFGDVTVVTGEMPDSFDFGTDIAFGAGDHFALDFIATQDVTRLELGNTGSDAIVVDQVAVISEQDTFDWDYLG